MRRLLPLLLLAACARPHVPVATLDAGAAGAGEVTVEVTKASRRALAAPRPDLIEQIGRLRSGGVAAPFSATDAFVAAAMAELAKKGLRARTDRRPGLAVFRITLDDLDVRNGAAAGAVAFVSARYVFLDAKGEALWQTAQKRVPIKLGGPDLTRPALVRVAAESVRRALVSLPASATP